MLSNLILAAAVTVAVPASASAAKVGVEGTGVIITNVAMGEIDPNGIIPTTNGVAGAGVSNIDIATPIALLKSGQQYAFTMAFHDLSYAGSCAVAAKFTQIQNGKKVLLKKIQFFSQDCGPGNVYLHYAKTRLPQASGPITLTVTVSYGDGKATMKMPLVMQYCSSVPTVVDSDFHRRIR